MITRRPHRTRPLVPTVLLAMAALAMAAGARAQVPGIGPTPIRFHGEVSSLGELYSVSGREQRRPSSVGRLYVRSSLELFDAVTVGFDVSLSTESGSGFGLSGESVRQQINQIGIRPEWSWGRAYLGSFTESYTPLTWSGIRVRGVGATINPGWLRLGAFGGRSQSAVPGGALDGAYRRTMWGGRVGIGRPAEKGQGGGLFDLVFIRTADDPNSLEPPEEVELEPDAGAAAGNAYAVTPQENVVVAAVNRLPFWSGRLVWRGELALSVLSRDVRAPELGDDEALDEYSSLLRSMVTPRASTYGDVAYTARLDLRRLELPGATRQSPRTVAGSIGYKYIGAGYVSLGLASLPADQSAINGRVSVRFRTWNASLQALHQHDNLLGQKLATTVRRRLAANASTRLTEGLRSSLRVGVNTVANHAADPGQRVDQTSWTVATSQALTLGRRGTWRALALSHTYQQTTDPTPARTGSELRAHDADVRVTLAPVGSLTLTPAVGVALSSRGEEPWALRHTYALSANLRGDDGRWSTTAAVTNSRLHAGGSLRGFLGARYRLTPDDRIQIRVRSNRVTGLDTESGGFSEYTATIGWSRRIR